MSSPSAPPRAARAPVVRLPRLVNASRFAAKRDVHWHEHPGMELVLVTEGHCRCEAGAKTLDARAGTLFVLPKRVPQFQHTPVFTRTTYAVIDDFDHCFDDTARTVNVQNDPFVPRWMEDLCELRHAPQFAEKGADRVSVAGALALAVLERINRIENRSADDAEWHPGLARAVRHLETRRGESVTVGELARHAHLSPSHLTALFRERFGCGPLQHLQKMRMVHARRLLEAPYLTVQEVAAECGYDDANYFVRIFRKHHKMPPGAWREKCGA